LTERRHAATSVGFNRTVTDERSNERVLQDAEDRLSQAERSGDEARLELLEELYSALERELDSDQTLSPGR
jgi:hypothetical protein